MSGALSLVIDGIPPIVLAEPTIIEASVAQLGSGGESPSVDVALDPGRGALVALLDPPPLRAAATLTYPDGSVFAGVVQSVRLGASSGLTIEA